MPLCWGNSGQAQQALQWLSGSLHDNSDWHASSDCQEPTCDAGDHNDLQCPASGTQTFKIPVAAAVSCPDTGTAQSSVDIVLAADVVYSAAQVTPLCSTLQHLLRAPLSIADRVQGPPGQRTPCAFVCGSDSGERGADSGIAAEAVVDEDGIVPVALICLEERDEKITSLFFQGLERAGLTAKRVNIMLRLNCSHMSWSDRCCLF
jgi:hypothetical protein